MQASFFFLPILILEVCKTTWADDETGTTSPCEKKAKAETYLDTAADMITKVKQHLPKNDRLCKCSPKPMDCDELLSCGHTENQVYKIWPRNRFIDGGINVYCDMKTDGGGWTVIQRRGDYQRANDFFDKKWRQYKTGFGDLQKDFWLGNDNIYALTNQRKYYLRIDLKDSENNTRLAFYDQFWIDNESNNYKLYISDYFGDAGDSLSPTHMGQMFSTVDRDNDVSSQQHCASKYKGGWWYAACFEANLNGVYQLDNNDVGTGGIKWNTWKAGESLKYTEMKLRPADYKQDLFIDVEPK